LKLYNSYAKLSSEKELPLTKAFLEIALTIGAFKQVDVPLLSSETVQGTSKSKAADPSALKVQMDVLTNRFAGYEQRDAHEFLGALIDFLHEELADKEGSNSVTADDEVAATVVTTDLPTDEYFHTKVRVCLECMSWPGYSRSREEFYRHLSVDWEKMPTVNLGESSGAWSGSSRLKIVSSTVRSVRVALLPLKRWRLFLGQYFFMWSLGCYNRSTAFTQRFHC